MTLRSDLAALRRLMGTAGDEPCPGVLTHYLTTYRLGESEPEPPLCEICGEPHWPDGHLVVCEVIVRSREEAERWTNAAASGDV
jgi:hypothetical protein